MTHATAGYQDYGIGYRHFSHLWVVCSPRSGIGAINPGAACGGEEAAVAFIQCQTYPTAGRALPRMSAGLRSTGCFNSGGLWLSWSIIQNYSVANEQIDFIITFASSCLTPRSMKTASFSGQKNLID
jgi:hypothetical protein